MRLTKYLTETGGAKAGRMEILQTSLEDARAYLDKLWREKGTSLDAEMPDFDINYQKAQNAARHGHTKRKDMPVIGDEDINTLLRHLKNGDIDIMAPFSDETDPSDLFPEFLKGKEAKHWLHNGKPKWDGGSKDDDVVRAFKARDKIMELKPIQSQIYFDKSVHNIVKEGVQGSIDFISKSTFVVSNDDHIIDGHHRYLSGMLCNHKMSVRVLKIDLPIHELLELTKAYGDAIGNKRNL
jgi:hypothetical protein